MRTTLALACGLVALGPVSARAQAPGAGALVIRGGTVIDGTGREPRVGIVVARGGRIECVGAEQDCPVPSGARVVDASGRFVLPGLIDTHVHLYWSTDSAGSRQTQALRFGLGITTVREAGTAEQLQANLARRPIAAAAERAEPKLVVAGLLKADGPPLIDQVRNLAALGVDAIKVKDPLPPTELIDATDEAHRLGLSVFGHMIVGEPPLFPGPDAPEAYDGVSHLQSIAPAAIVDPSVLPPKPAESDDIAVQRTWFKTLWLAADSTALAERIGALRERGSWLEPLLVTEEFFILHPKLDQALVDYAHFNPVRRRLREAELHRIRPKQQERLDSSLARARAFVLAFHRAGGMLLAGTDNSPIPGFSLHGELAALVAAGLTPSEALAAATRNAARAFGMEDSLGTLEAGKRADLVVLDADPLVDIRNTVRVWRVVKGGVVHDPAPLLAALRAEGQAMSPAALAAARAAGRAKKLIAAGVATSLAIGLFLGLLRRRRADPGDGS
ncbi:MAG: amidohydrolase family protein [Gemmatimonadales bacterium]